MRDHQPALAAAAAAAAATACLAAAGWLEPSLATPPITEPASLVAWWSRTGPIVATVGLFRLAGLAAGAYLDAALLVASLARATRRHRLQRWSTLLLPKPARGLLAVAAGICTLAHPVTASASTAPRPLSTPTFESRRGLGTSPIAPAGNTHTPTSTPHPHTRMDPPPILSPATPATPTPTPLRTPPVTTNRPRRRFQASTGPALASEWTVRPGQSFWSIAEAVVTSRSATESRRTRDSQETSVLPSPPPPELTTVVRYWTTLVAANLDRLPVPSNPDILYVGDQVVLPPIQ